MKLLTVFFYFVLLFLVLALASNYAFVIADVEYLLLLIFLFIVINLFIFLQQTFKNVLIAYQVEIKSNLLKDVFIFCFLLNKYRDFLIKKINILTIFIHKQKYITTLRKDYLHMNLKKLVFLKNYIYLNYLNVMLLDSLKIKKNLLYIDCLIATSCYKFKLFLLNNLRNTFFYYFINK